MFAGVCGRERQRRREGGKEGRREGGRAGAHSVCERGSVGDSALWVGRPGLCGCECVGGGGGAGGISPEQRNSFRRVTW